MERIQLFRMRLNNYRKKIPAITTIPKKINKNWKACGNVIQNTSIMNSFLYKIKH
jgi:hypothetical protein